MTLNMLKAFIISSVIIIFISLLMLDGGTSFIAIFVTSLYILVVHIMIKLCKKLNDYITGILIALICSTSPVLFELLMDIFPPLKF